MSQEPLDPRLAPPEAETVAEYASVSRLAVLAFVLGLGAVGAVFSPLMICLAVAGAILALAALHSIARAERPMLGRKAAVTALILSLFFGAWGMTWRWMRQRVIYAEAKQLADKWLQLVRAGRLQEAYQLHLSHHDRQGPGVSLADYYKNTREARFELDNFFREQPLRQIVAAGEQGQLRFVKFENLQNDNYAGTRSDVATLRYALDYEEDGQPRKVPMQVTIVRTLDTQGTEALWELRRVQTSRAGP